MIPAEIWSTAPAVRARGLPPRGDKFDETTETIKLLTNV
jgi:hypothetical protein